MLVGDRVLTVLRGACLKLAKILFVRKEARFLTVMFWKPDLVWILSFLHRFVPLNRPPTVSIMAIFDKSHDQNRENPKTQMTYRFVTHYLSEQVTSLVLKSIDNRL